MPLARFFPGGFALRPLIIATAVAAVSLAACGKKPEAAASGGQASSTVTIREGDTVTTQTVAPAPPAAPGSPGKMPPFAPLYPGAVVKATSASTANGHQVRSVTYVTAASPREVIDFYKPRTVAAGFSSGAEANIGVGLMYAANDTPRQRTMQVIATAEKDGTAVILSWTGPTP